jgi:serine/threonine protein kinase
VITSRLRRVHCRYGFLDEYPSKWAFRLLNHVAEQLLAKRDEFAMKRLLPLPDVETNFREEFESLRRWEVSLDLRHHFVRLLATFEILFPWGDGNLADFLRSAESDQHARTAEAGLWLAQQAYELGSALQALHDPHVLEDGQGSDQDKLYGRHGDLKPSNIIVFREPEKPDALGHLFISDMGLSSFHRRQSRSNIPTLSYSLSYAAPEIEERDKRTSRKIDVWGLGCVFLELAIWYVKGSPGVYEFEKARLVQDARFPQVETDAFYGFESESDHQPQVKPVVVEWTRSLFRDESCSPFLGDFLDLISRRMLVASPAKRARASEVAERLEEMMERCGVDSKYYRPLERRGTISKLVHSLGPRFGQPRT